MKNKNSAGSILLFPILLIAGIGLLWWNEGNYVKTASAIKEAQSDYLEIKDAKYDAKNDKKVVVVSGPIVVSSEAVDQQFKIKDMTAILERTVEMYQWEEDCDEDNHCTYEKKWSESEISSAGFKSGHSNPSMPYKSETFYSDNVTLGDYSLSRNNLEYLNADSPYQLNQQDATNNGMTLLQDNRLYKGKDFTQPEIGDLLVSFSKFTSDKVTVLGVQNGTTVTKFVGKSGKKVMYTMEGIHTGDEMFQKLIDNNKMMTWLLRLVGCICLICAIASIFAPLRFLTDRIPILGGIVGGLTGFFALLVGLALSIIVIALAWFAYRPLASIIAIVVMAGLVILYIKMKGKKAMDNKQEAVTTQQTETPQQPVTPTQEVQPTENVEQKKDEQ
ncbi:MAG: TMEM43 family protein [Bacilli bacterium]|nr:TMEM43 family protein [Bacilli bacterium]